MLKHLRAALPWLAFVGILATLIVLMLVGVSHIGDAGWGTWAIGLGLALVIVFAGWFTAASGGVWLVLAAVALPHAAEAQGRVCGPHDRIVEQLASEYGESRQSIGLGLNNAVVEVFANLETGTWTITVTAPAGPTCLVAAGEAFQHMFDPLPPEGDPT